MAELDQFGTRLGDYRVQRNDPQPVTGMLPDLPPMIRDRLFAVNPGVIRSDPVSLVGMPPNYEYTAVPYDGSYQAPGFVGGGLSDTGNAPAPGTAPGGLINPGFGLRGARVRELSGPGGYGSGRHGDDRGRTQRGTPISEMSQQELAGAIRDADFGIDIGLDEAAGGLIQDTRDRMADAYGQGLTSENRELRASRDRQRHGSAGEGGGGGRNAGRDERGLSESDREANAARDRDRHSSAGQGGPQ